MSWSNVKLIFLREVRDQLRDRRTLFTIVVLPVLLYPLMGMCFLQVHQFLQEHPSRVRIVGAEHLPGDPPLLVDGQIAPNLADEHQRRLLELEIVDPADDAADASRPAASAAEDRRSAQRRPARHQRWRL
jgi:sodium transport system permease protein